MLWKKLSDDEDGDVLDQMLLNFDNETENGKLYISYPMVEALRDFEPGKCGDPVRCLLPISEIRNYKTVSATALYPQFDRYNYEIWKGIIDVYSMRLSCLMNEEEMISYNTYIDTVTPREVQLMEKREYNKGYVFILSAFPEFLLDYYGIRLWKTCVKHTGNQLSACIKKHIRGS